MFLGEEKGSEWCRRSESSSIQPVTILMRRIIAKAAEAVKDKSYVRELEGLKKFIGQKKARTWNIAEIY